MSESEAGPSGPQPDEGHNEDGPAGQSDSSGCGCLIVIVVAIFLVAGFVNLVIQSGWWDALAMLGAVTLGIVSGVVSKRVGAPMWLAVVIGLVLAYGAGELLLHHGPNGKYNQCVEELRQQQMDLSQAELTCGLRYPTGS